MAPLSLDTSVGALEIGILISTVLFGVMTTQTYVYLASDHFKRDKAYIKILVGFVWLVEALHTALSWSYLYGATITRFGKVLELLIVPWDLASCVLLSGVVGCAVQLFFAWRIYVVSSRIIFAIPGWTCSVFRLALAVALAATSLKARLLPVFVQQYRWLTNLAIANTMALDAYNAMSLILLLRRRRSRFRNTRLVLDKLTLWTVETGAVTSIASILMLACIVSMPNNAIWLGILLFYAKLYSNSLLVL
ncbi:hypothetical protein PUNSTDRAFT_68019 [Punctularia strigosozonata HHB-11173 SS5]|uniref:uncharacterized protein n=1 Tax=Punctularia strigosozonata (strain HHB-11173) TaxID=741275 RepID=UPI0004418669|nr:uncharacterized protein PUNSTDRAFT_68019 [Punctularia strigosozonata HHB-11173 SS5]EIN09219.1 hypothetical protein PUNSTDRAFT_68019 [Punctularia strigosozonata HHB-11173 SS5]